MNIFWFFAFFIFNHVVKGSENNNNVNNNMVLRVRNEDEIRSISVDYTIGNNYGSM